MKSFTIQSSVVLVIFVAIISSGCGHLHEFKRNGKVGPNYQTPGAKVASDWTVQNSPYVISATNAVDNNQWWTVFQDPEIDKMVSAANKNNLPLRVAILRVKEQQHLRDIAVGNLFPTSQTFNQYSRIQFGQNGNQFGIGGFGNTFNLYNVGFNASWEVDLWGRLRRIVESSEAQIDATIEDEHDVRLALISDVVATYIEIRLLQQRIKIAKDQVEAQQETQRLASSRFEGGTAGKLDVTQATSIVEATRATIPPLESSLQQANNRLCLLLGIPTRTLFDSNNIGDIPVASDSVVIGMPRDLLRRRPDIRRAEREIATQSAQIGVAVAELFPTFSLKGTIDWQSFKYADLIESGSQGGSIIPGVRWNVLNFGRLKNNIKVQETRLEQTVAAYRQTVLNANAEAEDALTAYIKKKEEIVAIKRALKATEDSVEVAKIQYKEGEVDLDRVNNLRKDLIAQLDLVTAAEGQATIALIRVFKTMGGGWKVGAGTVLNTGKCAFNESMDPRASIASRGRYNLTEIPSSPAMISGNESVFNEYPILDQTQKVDQQIVLPTQEFGYKPSIKPPVLPTVAPKTEKTDPIQSLKDSIEAKIAGSKLPNQLDKQQTKKKGFLKIPKLDFSLGNVPKAKPSELKENRTADLWGNYRREMHNRR